MYTNGFKQHDYPDYYRKGRKRCSEYEDNGCSKRFCCEDNMSLHMQQLFIAAASSSPPRQHCSTPCCSSWSNDDTHMTDDEVTSEPSSRSSHDDQQQHPTRLWIAPEVNKVINNSSINLLPKEILKEVGQRPCLALVPYVDHSITWLTATSHGSQSDQASSSSSSSVSSVDDNMSDQDELCDYIDDEMDVL